MKSHLVPQTGLIHPCLIECTTESWCTKDGWTDGRMAGWMDGAVQDDNTI